MTSTPPVPETAEAAPTDPLLGEAEALLAAPQTRDEGLRALARYGVRRQLPRLAIEALDAIDAAAKATRKTARNTLFLEARARFRLGDYAGCLEALDRITDSGVASFEALFLKAVCWLVTGSPRVALEAALRAEALCGEIEVSPEDRARAEWLATYLHGVLGAVEQGRRFGGAALIDRWRGPAPGPSSALVGVLDFKNPQINHSSVNIGDPIQTLAALRHLARIDADWTFDDPDLSPVFAALAKSWGPDAIQAPGRAAHVVLLDRDFPWSIAQRFPDRPVWTVWNGWFSHPAFDVSMSMPGPDNLEPLIAAFHLAMPQLGPRLMDWLKRFEPIGCRDWNTVYWLSNRGVSCFFSGCLTWTLSGLFEGQPKSGALYVDVDPPSGQDAAHFAQEDKDQTFRPLSQSLEMALGRLRTYARAERIVTSRLHCALPAQALGAEVTFVTDDPADRRFEGLIGASRQDAARSASEASRLLASALQAVVAGQPAEVVRKLWGDNAGEMVERTRTALQPTSFHLPPRPARPADRRDAPVPDGTISIALAIDEARKPAVQALLRSIRRNTGADLRLVLLTRGLDAAGARRIAAIAEPREVLLAPMDGYRNEEDRLAGGPSTDLLWLDELAPSLDRIVWLDCDALALGDISELFHHDSGSAGIGARATGEPGRGSLALAVEANCRRLGADRAIALRRWVSAHADLSAPCFDPGVMVLSLERLRTLDTFATARELVRQFGLSADDALNFASGGAFAPIPRSWNMTPATDFDEHPQLVHWRGGPKPWGPDPVRFKALWTSYAEALDAGAA